MDGTGHSGGLCQGQTLTIKIKASDNGTLSVFKLVIIRMYTNDITFNNF